MIFNSYFLIQVLQVKMGVADDNRRLVHRQGMTIVLTSNERSE